MLVDCATDSVAAGLATCDRPARPRFMAIAAILLATAGGCAGHHVRTAVQGTASGSLTACGAGVGLSAELPILADGRFFDLLEAEQVMCPGGAIATLGGDPDKLLSIACPGARIAIYCKADAILPDCVPEPLKTLNPDAARMAAAAVSRIGADRRTDSLKLAKKASDIQPDSEFILAALASAQMANGDFAGAEKTLSRAIGINPDSPALRLAHAVAMSELGDKNSYAAEIARLYDDLPVDHTMRPDLQCRLADNQNRLGNRKVAITMAREACRAGATMCCGMAASDPEPVEVVPWKEPGIGQGDKDQGSM